MKIFLLFICVFDLAVPAVAERVTLPTCNTTNTSTHQLFNRLAQYHDAPGSIERLNATQRAFTALLGALAPAIRNLTNYTGIFSGNCSVFFEESIESAACDITPAETRPLEPAARFVSSKHLPQSYWSQITRSHVLLATVFADWAKAKLQECYTDLYFKQGTCSDTTSETMTLALPTPVPPTPVPTTAVPPTPVPTTPIPTLACTGAQTVAAASVDPGLSDGQGTRNVAALCWQLGRVGSGRMSQTSAISYCSGLGGGWRLPNIWELAELFVQYRVLGADLVGDWFWSSTTVDGNPNNAWVVYFNFGSLDNINVGDGFFVRCAADLFPPTPTPTTPPSAGLLAAWSQTGGTYADTTNQPGRYNTSNGVVADALTGIEWEQAASASAMNWTAAQAYCANQTTGNLTGWRLPNIGELQTLVDFTIASSTPINSVAFPVRPATDIWASTPEAGDPGKSWILVFSNCCPYSVYTGIGISNKVRCVRSNYLSPSMSRYMVSSGEVTDMVTGLIWQQVSTGGKMNQAAGVSHCSGLGLNGHTWRLPTIKELVTLVDYSISNGTSMMNSVFNGSASYYWSSTRLAGNSFYGWLVNFGSGIVNGVGEGVLGANYIRCMR